MLILSALLLALSCPPPAAAGKTTTDYAAELALGNKLFSQGKDAQARAAFAKAADFPAADFRAEAGLARVDADLGREDQATVYYLRARGKAPLNYGLCMELAHHYVQMGRLDLAKRTFAQAKSLDPAQADAYIEEGYADLRSGKSAQAQEQFQDVISIDTSSPYGYHHMASYFRRRGDLAAAEGYMRKSLALFKSQPSALPAPLRRADILHGMHNLALVLMEEGRLDEAEAVLLEALPQSAATKTDWRVVIPDRLGGVYLRQGKREKAEAFFRQAAALCDPADSCARFLPLARIDPLLHLATLYADEGRRPQAEAALDKAWNRFPAVERMAKADLYCAVTIGELYSRLGDDAKAERTFRWALSSPDRMSATSPFGSAASRLADLCRKSGRYEDASRLYRDAIRVARLDGRTARTVRLACLLTETRLRAWANRVRAP